MPFRFFQRTHFSLGITLIFILASVLLFSSCSRDEEGEEVSMLDAAFCPPVEPEIIHVPITAEVVEQEGFRPDFAVINLYSDKQELKDSLEARKIRVSNWANAVIDDSDFVPTGDRAVYNIVVVSMLELGFLENELASYTAIVDEAAKEGLVPMPFETAVMIREQFMTQPEYMSGHRLGEFFIAIHEPKLVQGDPIPKIPSVSRDDEFPHPETGVGLWIVMNAIQLEDGGPRLFDPLDPLGADRGGRFAFVVPDEINLDLIETTEATEAE